jgi:voltage-gated potassium channel
MSSVIVFGYNHLGSSIAKNLKSTGNNVVVVDNNIHNCKQASKDGFEIYETDFSDDDEVVDWGIGIGAEYLFCVSSNDDLNLYLTLTARTIDPSLFIIVRSEDSDSKTKLLLSGANETIDLGEIGAQKIYSLINSPNLSALLDGALNHNNSFFFKERLSIETVTVTRDCFLNCNMSFSIDFKELFNIIVLAIKESRPNSKPLFNLSGLNHLFKEGDCIVVMGKVENIKKMRDTISSGADI